MSEVEPGWVWDGVVGLDYEHAAYVIGMPLGWLKEKVPAEEVPHGRYGRRVVFTPDDIAEIRRMHHQPAKNVPDAAVVTVDVITDPAAIRTALIAADHRSAA